MPKTTKHAVKKPNTTQDPYRVRTPRSVRFAASPDTTHPTIETGSKMSTQNALPATSLTPTNGNRRKSSRVPLQSQKEKENSAQQRDGIVVLEDEVIGAMDTTEDGGEDVTGQDMVQLIKKLLAAQVLDQRQRKQESEELKQQIAALKQQMTVVIQQNNETQEKLVQVQQRAEELETRLHQMQEQSYTGLAVQPINITIRTQIIRRGSSKWYETHRISYKDIHTPRGGGILCHNRLRRYGRWRRSNRRRRGEEKNRR